MSVASTCLSPSREKRGHVLAVAMPRSLPDRAAFSVAETAEMLGLSEASIYRLLKRGALPSVLIGGSRRIPATGIHALLTPNETTQAA